MKPCIACLLLVSVICLQSACIRAIDWESLDNPGGPVPVVNPAPAPGVATSQVSSADAEKAMIEAGKIIYQKYIDGNYLDKDGFPDRNNAPAALQRETSEWAERVENAGYDIDTIMEKVESAFM